MLKRTRSPLLRYGVAVVAVALALLLKLLLTPLIEEESPFLLFFGAVMVSAYSGGFGPGLLATLGAALVSDYFFLTPTYSFLGHSPGQNLRLGLFVLEGVLISLLGARLQRAEKAERAQREYFQVTLASIGDAVIVTDRKGKVTFMNRVAQALTGWEGKEAAGKSLPEVFHIENEETRQPAEDPVTRVLHEGVVAGLANHTVLRAKDGSEKPIDDSAAPIRDDQGRLLGVELVFRDITEHKRAEEALARQAEELGRSNEELQQFAYVSSHDLQEPLRMVTSYVQLLAKRYQGRLDADADEFIGYAVEGAKRMQELIEDLLTYARVDTKGQEFKPTDCAAVLANTLGNLRVAIEESGGEVTHDPLPTVLGDPVQLGQVFQNLIGNALKFHKQQPPRVHVSAEQKGHEWVFSVRDDGIGLDPQYAERIFVIFQRLHPRREYPGTGIGLAICKKIVEQDGGRIWVESEPGRGATFFFTIPNTPKRGNLTSLPAKGLTGPGGAAI